MPSNGPTLPQLQLGPTKPRSGRPDLYVRIGAVREVLVSLTTHKVVGYRYFFDATSVRCVNGANHVIFTVGRSRRTLSCKRSPILISGQLAPHKSYRIAVQAVRMRRRRVVKRGARYSGQLYMPGNEVHWTPISQLPPSS